MTDSNPTKTVFGAWCPVDDALIRSARGESTVCPSCGVAVPAGGLTKHRYDHYHERELVADLFSRAREAADNRD